MTTCLWILKIIVAIQQCVDETFYCQNLVQEALTQTLSSTFML